MAHVNPTMHEHEWRSSSSWPPLTRMDIVGMVVAALGTAALILIAAVSVNHDHTNPYSVVTIARVLIATGALLINMAHIVGIFFFESVDYHGPFQRFFARLSMIGTAVALIVSLGLGLL
jgi:hypothetical protein